jgi:ElaB/YqjD/DUF883 family membrane-anchored ribosome-binding protein
MESNKCAEDETGNTVTEHRFNQSAESVRQFDCKPADVMIREIIRQSPGRSLLIAGALGLLVGVVVRRR